MTIGFIGAGKVGFTLGKYLGTHGFRVAGYHSRSTDSAEQAAEFTGTRAYPDLGALVSCCDALFLTVPDSSITEVFGQLCAYPIAGKLICHCSGALSAGDAFPGIEETGAFGYSVHPLFAVSDPYKACGELADVFFALEGHPAHLEHLRDMLARAGLRVRVIDARNKTLYHCAAATASNLVVGLLGQSLDMMVRCGFSRDDALQALAPLIEGNVQHVLYDGPAAALTGPLERGDSGTIQKHLRALEDMPDTKELYRRLSLSLLPIAQEKHPERSYASIKTCLTQEGKDSTP